VSGNEPNGARADAPVPEGVVILGMHRSGTSLVTRLVNMLGLAVCRDDDLVVGRVRNPRGHWESKSLVSYNDRLLEELGASWFCPPPLGARETARMLSRHASEALALLREAHPRRPWVWKDPRTCALLPFWSAVLERRAAYLLVARHPFEVSDSLQSRNGCTPLLSLALWERYTRRAMLDVAGRPAMVCTYDRVLADPIAWSERLAAFLGELGLATRPVDRLAVEAFVTDQLRHSSQSWTELQPGPRISPEQVALAHAASEFTTQRSYTPPALPRETPRTAAVFEEIVRVKPGRRGLRALPAHLAVVEASAGRANEESWPPVSVVLARASAAAIEASLTALGETLLAGCELLIAGRDAAGAAERAGASEWARERQVALRVLEREREPSEAEALALGARAARGRLVVLSDARATRIDPWYRHLRKTLSTGEIGAVEPVLRLERAPASRYFGRIFDDEDLATSHLAADAREAPVPAALMAGAHTALIRVLLDAAGGVDSELDSANAAFAELSVRLWRMGFRCLIDPRVEVWVADGQAGAGQDGAGSLAGHEAGRPGAGVDEHGHGDAASEARNRRAGSEDDPMCLHDRLRIAALHFGPERLQAFTERASRLPGYRAASERLAASDVELRRVRIEAVCAFPVEYFLERFPPGHTEVVQLPSSARPSRRPALARLRRRLRSS